MLAIMMRYLATGQSYSGLMYGFRVAHNTICGVVKEVCQAIIDEYEDDIQPLPQHSNGKISLTNSLQDGTFIMYWGL